MLAHPNKEWIKGGYAASEIIGEALARAMHARREILSEERTHARENARSRRRISGHRPGQAHYFIELYTTRTQLLLACS